MHVTSSLFCILVQESLQVSNWKFSLWQVREQKMQVHALEGNVAELQQSLSQERRQAELQLTTLQQVLTLSGS